ncbi:MAG: peptide chain release factor N(5)-glutamine methyltransferase [Bdellovibrionota bacterium]
MTIEELIGMGVASLQQMQISDPKRDAIVLLQYVMQMSHVDLITKSTMQVSQEAVERYQVLLAKRCQHIPVAYLIEQKEFYGLDFYITPSVLIPRPETEALIDLLLVHHQKQKIKRLLDVGTGSGVIAITAKKHMPSVEVVAVDIDREALTVAKKNARRHEVNVMYQQSDLMQYAQGMFDVIVSNLPYIDTQTIKTLSQEVQNEPMLALDGGEAGMEIFKRFLPQTQQHLANDGVILLEIGFDQKAAIVSCARENGYTRVEVLQDLQGNDRVAVIQR